MRRGKKKPDTGKTAGSDKPLGTTNPVLYELCEQKSFSVAQVVSGAVTICHEPTGDITGWAYQWTWARPGPREGMDQAAR